MITMETNTGGVTMSAVIKRINRKLVHENLVLKTARSWSNDTGWYYCVHTYTNMIEAAHIDPDVWGRELGVMRSYEHVLPPSTPCA